MGSPPVIATAVIHVDTSLLVDALTGPRESAAALRQVFEDGERLAISTLVLYEWRRGPRVDRELAYQEQFFPTEQAVPFGHREAALAAGLYHVAARARRREFDLAIAACALSYDAALWTLNPDDFRDIPNLVLYQPPPR